MKKQRIDQRLVDEAFFSSREKAKRAVMAGMVFVAEQRVEKPGTQIDIDKPIYLKGERIAYVGRGGLKMEKALQTFALDVNQKIVLDIGASTGGFTDCCLQKGAKLVYALDVGYNQLAWKLRNDPRVIVQERKNFRYADVSDFSHGLPHLATIDVSFISLTLILPVLRHILAAHGDCVALIKPQFEAKRENVGKKGVVKDPECHKTIIQDMTDFATKQGFAPLRVTYSPVTGGQGNIEYLLHLRLSPATTEITSEGISRVVDEAVRSLT